MGTRRILHVDLDQFQVSVERRRSPELVGVPVIVGGDGDPTAPRKVVTCASYEARAVGVRAGMPLRVAHRKMPDAVYLPLDVEAYDDASAEVMATLRGFGAVEVWGWDEAYLGAGELDDEQVAALAVDRAAFEDAFDVVRLALALQVLDDAVHLVIADEGAVHAHRQPGA